jgi:osmoprotectant transport system permease protein
VSEQLAAAFRVLPLYLGWHVVLSASALGLGLLGSGPLAVLAARSARVRWPVLAVAGLIQTIPSLALLALFYPVLLALSALAKKLFGQGFPALGFLPSLLALTLYSMLPMLRNAVTGLTGVDPAITEAAKGVGMTDRQRLWRVEAPLAAPVAMAGVRTAAVWVIGTATLATPVGQTSLGDYIFSGLQTENWVLVLFGCAASAGLAFVVDQLLGLIETGLAKRDRRRIVVGLGALLLGVALASIPILAAAVKPEGYRVGAKNFSEQYILADLICDQLEKTGARVTEKNDLGSVIAFRALAAGDIDVYVDYSGTLWTSVLGHKDTPPRAQLLAQMGRELKDKFGVVVLGPLGFENAYALAMRRNEAETLGVRSIADLAPHAPDLALGSDLEFLSRIEWRGLQRAYGLHFRTERQFQPTFMYKAVSGGEADVISAFSSDGRIAADDLVVLNDPKGAIPPYDAVILLSPGRADDRRLLGALRPLLERIPVQAMRQANLSVDRDTDKRSPSQAARALEETIGLK